MDWNKSKELLEEAEDNLSKVVRMLPNNRNIFDNKIYYNLYTSLGETRKSLQTARSFVTSTIEIINNK